jgi:hypothetical protein
MQSRSKCCATCRFFCQDVDPESRLYFDANSGECRAYPPSDHFVWKKTRPYHWCGGWGAREEKQPGWNKTATHPKDAKPVILYREKRFCKQAGMVIGYWNASFEKWHDDGDQLIDSGEITDWMPLPAPPK